MLKERFIIKDDFVETDKHQSERIDIGKGQVTLTFVGNDECIIYLFRSGDFCLATSQTHLTSKAKLRDGFRIDGKLYPVELAPLPRKKLHFSGMFFIEAEAIISLTLNLNFVAKSKLLSEAFFLAALKGIKFKESPTMFLKLRPLAELHGYNVIYKNGNLIVKFFRRRRTKLNYTFYPFSKSDEISEYMITTFNVNYSNQGFK